LKKVSVIQTDKTRKSVSLRK